MEVVISIIVAVVTIIGSLSIDSSPKPFQWEVFLSPQFLLWEIAGGAILLAWLLLVVIPTIWIDTGNDEDPG